MKKLLVRSAFEYDGDGVSDATGLKCEDASVTRQEFKEECDINTLVRRFGITGELPVIERLPIVADFVQAIDYKTALDSLIAADNTFMELPADVRKRFNHDPGEFVDFCSNPENLAELRKMGLAPTPEPKPMASAGPAPAEPAAGPEAG